MGSRRELCEVESVPVDGGREIEHGGSDQAEQSGGEAERGPSGDEKNAAYGCELLGSMRVPSVFRSYPVSVTLTPGLNS